MTEETERKEVSFYAGYAEAKITPPLGINIPGYFKLRISDGVITDLFLRAVAFDDGATRLIFFSCDAVKVMNPAAAELRRLIAERCGTDPGNVYITCTHSHTSMRIDVPDSDSANDVFLRRLYQIFCDTAQFAFEDLKPASMKTALGQVSGVGFKRRYYMKDGSTKTNPGQGNPDVVGPVGEQDNSLRLLRVIREGAKEILMVCYGTHPDTVGGTKYCADWPGYLIDTLKGAFCGEAEAILFNGCQGDSASKDHTLPKGSDTFPKGPERALRMGRILAGDVLKIYDDAEEICAVPFAATDVTVKVGKNPYDPEMVPIAREMQAIYKKTHDISCPELKPYKEKLNLPEALRILANLNRPEFFELPVTVVRMGDVAFVGMPGEPFQDTGYVIKEKSPFPVTLVTALTNGGSGYFPTRAAFETPGYERSNSPFAWDVAEKLEEGALEGLDQLYPKEK